MTFDYIDGTADIKLTISLNDILAYDGLLTDIFYEEPFVGQYIESSMTLVAMRTFIPEILIEKENELKSQIAFHEVNNKTWKKDLLGKAVPVGTEKEKEAIKSKVDSLYSCYSELTQDGHDAFGIALYGLDTILGAVRENIKFSKGYALDGEFVAADCDDGAFSEYQYVKDSIPRRLRDGEVDLIDIGKKQDVEEEVYRALHERDVVILAKFVPQEHGRILLKYQLGELTNNDYIYWYVWRKVRYIGKR